jgi:hypothetical protein
METRICDSRRECRICHRTHLCSRCAGVVHLATRPAPGSFKEMQKRLAVRDSIHNYLTRYEDKLPDIQGASSEKCDLFPTPRAFVFSDEGINSFLAELFSVIATATSKDPCIPDVQLTRYDLFHAHLFQVGSSDHELGLLFHAKEFPELCKDFPYNLGYCQHSSALKVGATGMDWRNFVWYQNRLAALDLAEGSRLLKCLAPEYLQPLRTTYEVLLPIQHDACAASCDGHCVLCLVRYHLHRIEFQGVQTIMTSYMRSCSG